MLTGTTRGQMMPKAKPKPAEGRMVGIVVSDLAVGDVSDVAKDLTQRHLAHEPGPQSLDKPDPLLHVEGLIDRESGALRRVRIVAARIDGGNDSHERKSRNGAGAAQRGQIRAWGVTGGFVRGIHSI